MAQPERHAYLDINVDDITPVTCTIGAQPDEAILRHVHIRGNVHVYSRDYHPAHEAVVGQRATVQVFTDDERSPADRPRPDHGVTQSIGLVTIEARFYPVTHSDGDGGSYEAPPADSWIAVTGPQFDAILSTLAANHARGFPSRLRLQLVGNQLPGGAGYFVDVRDLVVPEKRSYPVGRVEFSATYT